MFAGRGRSDDSWLDWKIRIFFVGAGLALIGLAMDNGWIMGAAIAVLLGGLILRFLPVGAEESESAFDVADDEADR